ncbi:MAG: PqqD family protein [Microcoleaceae cyanobacterium]
MLKESAFITTSRYQRSSQINHRAVVLNLESEEYFIFNFMGTAIWYGLTYPRKVQEIREIILSHYQVRPKRCERDLIAFLNQLQALGLIQMIPYPQRISRIMFVVMSQFWARMMGNRLEASSQIAWYRKKAIPAVKKLPYEAPVVSYWGSNRGAEHDAWTGYSIFSS